MNRRLTIGVLLIAGWILGALPVHGADGVRRDAAGKDSGMPAKPVETEGVDASQAVFDHFRQASALMAEGRDRQALQHANKALGLGIAALGKDDPRLAPLHNEVGVMLHRLGRHAEAAAHLETALALKSRQYPSGDPRLSLAMNNLASAYAAQDRLVDAARLQREALALDRRAHGPDAPAVADDLNNLAAILQRQGRLDEAGEMFRQALAIHEDPDDADPRRLAGLCNNVALTEKLQGRFDAAIVYYRRALDHLFAMGDAGLPDLGLIEGNLAMLQRDTGDTAAAEASFRKALLTYRRHPGNRPAEMAMVINGYASLLRDRYRYAEAAELFEKVRLSLTEALGADHTIIAAIENNMGELALARGDLSNARAHLQRARDICVAQEEPPLLLLATVFQNIAHLDQRQGDLRKAEARLCEALALSRRLGTDHYQSMEILASLAMLHCDSGDLEEAVRVLDKALTIATRVLPPRHPRQIEMLNAMAGLHVRAKAFDAANAYSAQAAALVKARLEAVTGDGASRRLLRHVLINRIDLLNRLAPARPGREGDIAREAFIAAQWAMASRAGDAFRQLAARFAVGSDELARQVRRRQDLRIRRHNLESQLTQRLIRSDPLDDDDAPTILRRQLDRVETELSLLSGKIAAGFPDFASLEMPVAQTAADVQRLLGRRDALLLVLTGETESYVWLLDRERITMASVPVGQKALGETVARLKRGLNQADVIFADEIRPFDVALAHRLYGQLFTAVEDRLAGIDRLVVVVDGPLASLPFGILVRTAPTAFDPQKNDYAQVDWLIHHVSLLRLPMVASLGALQKTVGPSSAPSLFAGFGDPVLSNPWGDGSRSQPRGKTRVRVSDVRRLTRLPETADELRSVALILGAGPDSLLLGENATEGRVRAMALDRFRILAFATHALMAEDLPGLAEPALVLSPPEAAGDAEDGLLTTSEISGLRLDAEMVILSACNSAAPDGSADGQTLSGLARAFIYAGSRSLLVSHWPVSSHATKELMIRFFKAWNARHPQDPACALAEAMRAMMSQTPSEYAHPMFWAPFSVVGALPQEVRSDINGCSNKPYRCRRRDGIEMAIFDQLNRS